MEKLRKVLKFIFSKLFYCRHSYKPAYWRSREPSYKRCELCGKTKMGSKREIKEWADNSPWEK